MAVRSLKLDADGDLIVDGTGLHTIGDDANEVIAQSIRTRLGFFKGEWFLDELRGVPWLQSILMKAPDLVAVRATLRATIAATPGVLDVPSLVIAFDAAARSLSVTFTATTDAGVLSDTLTTQVPGGA